MRKAHETLNQCQKQNGWNNMTPAYRRDQGGARAETCRKRDGLHRPWTGGGE